MRQVDNHSHILLAKLPDMVHAAKANNVTELSITEHVSQFRGPRESIRFGSVHTTGRIFASLTEYNDEFRNLEESNGIKVNRGLEVDYSPRYEKKVADFVNQMSWDLLLVSVHELEDGRDMEADRAGTIDPRLAHQRWRDYLRLETMALESSFIPFNVLAHPIRMARSNPTVPPELDELLEALARTARAKNKALELNGSDVNYAPQLVRRLASACTKGGCKVSYGSDAHHPRFVMRNHDSVSGIVDSMKLDLM